MRRVVKRIVSAVISMSMLLSSAACSTSKEDAEQNKVTEVAYGQVWSAPSTVKIKQDEVDYADKATSSLTYQAVRNEYESCQLIITAEKEVKSFELQSSDLKCGENVLSGENIEVYVQKYIPYSNYAESGYMPDALIPMEAADEYGENTIKAGANGALWVTIYIPKETEAGLYKGTFQLVLDGKEGEEKMDVPVSVNVHDYTLADLGTARTLFSWRYDRVAAGELDGSIEMMTYYYEFFQNYRISLQSLPVEGLSGEEYANKVLKYYDQLTTFSILSEAGNVSGSLWQAEDEVKDQILSVAAVCTPEKNLFDKAMIYCMDEPNLNDPGTRATVVSNIQKLNELLQRCVDIIKGDDSNLYTQFKQIDNWESSILDIPNVIPLNTSEWLLENEKTEEGQKLLKELNCVCIIYSLFDEEEAAKLVPLFEKHDIKLWWYGCTNPRTPGATYHISDKNLLSSRTVSWLQHKYDVEGNLYWDAAAYTNEASDAYNQYINVYEYPYRSTTMDWPAGDGFLTYPGAAYGIYGPLPSLRLMSIRDGMEEYEILQDIETVFKAQADSFGEDFSAAQAMDAFYRAIAEDVCKMHADGENGLDFSALRTELIELVVGMNEGLGFVISQKEVLEDTARFTYYVQNGATVTIDGKQQEPVSGNTYEYKLNVSQNTNIQVAVTNAAGKTVRYDRFIADPLYIMNSLSKQSVMEGIYVTDQSAAEFVSNDTYSTDGSAVHFNVQGVLTGDELTDATFVPSVSIATSLFGKLQPADLSRIKMDLYNPGENFTVKVRLYSGTAYADFGEWEVGAGKTTVTLDIAQTQFKQLETADRIAFEFVNAMDDAPLSYEFYLDNVVGEK